MENYQYEKKPRVLCLHGHGSSAEILKKELDFKEIYNFEECLQYVEANMEKYGPFDGVLGFSQGAILTASMPGMQRERVALTKVPKIKFVIIIAGAKFGGLQFGCPNLASNAFASPIECPSLHFIGEKDPRILNEEELVGCFMNPVVIYYPEGHKVPNLDAESIETVIEFINKVKKIKIPLQGNSNL
ncbi:hypothetical protein KY285_025444 [Solanum tuberosum]|nr:hypothetical protein KY289_023863 [Solanum tuberosum]KAH0677643.1 hypothetical protein KY285_025444 [Solanum tuberosum]